MPDVPEKTGLAEEVKDALGQLDGTTASAVALLTGMSRAELDEYGGFAE